MRTFFAMTILGVTIAGCSGLPVKMTPAREAAVHECSVKASAYSMTSAQSSQIIIYDKCMAEHRQIP
jgi:hypothetical protein